MNKLLAKVLTPPRTGRQAFMSWAWITATAGSIVGIVSLAYLVVVGYTAQDTTVWLGMAGASANVRRPLAGSTAVQWEVYPYGWEALPLPLKNGQTIRLNVHGRVSLDLPANVDTGQLRKELEEQIASRSLANMQPVGDARPPEDLLTADMIRLLSDPMSTGPWTGPGGYEPMTTVSKVRASRRALPGAPLGALIGQFRGSHCSESDAATFLIGANARIEVPCDAVLWMSVNEVVFKPAPWLMYQDNAGSFIASISLVD